MKYPALRAYKAAILNTQNINIPFFKSQSIQIFLNKRGEPYMSVGGFGAVFRFKDKQDNQYALKVFTRDVAGREERYMALHNTLKITKFPFMVDFHYVHEGLKVGKSLFPVVVMQWVKGTPLNLAIEKDLQDDGVMQSAANIAGNIFQITKTLQEWNMGHGDFQEGNLIVTNNNQILLIDYDGMYVPSLDEKKASEMGLADYQHPGRNINSFGSTIDDFAMLSILYQLSIVTPAFWEAHKGDSRLMLKEMDYKKPGISALFKSGLSSKQKHTKALANMLLNALKNDPLKINAIQNIESSSDIMNWLKFSVRTSPQKNFTSIIEKVVTLTNDQVQDFEKNQTPIITDKEYTSVSNPVPQKNRTDENDEQVGAWDFISDLFFEENVQTKTPPKTSQIPSDPKNKVMHKIKNSISNLFFEEIEDDENSPKQKPAQQISDPGPTKNTQPPTPPSGDGNQQKSGDKKQAPVPDWIKKRKKNR